MNKSKMFTKIDLYESDLDNVTMNFIKENVPYDISSHDFNDSAYENVKYDIEQKLYHIIDKFIDEKYLFNLSENLQETPLTISSGYYSGDIDCMEIDNEKPLLFTYSFFIDSISKDIFIKGYVLYNNHKIYIVKGIERKD